MYDFETIVSSDAEAIRVEALFFRVLEEQVSVASALAYLGTCYGPDGRVIMVRLSDVATLERFKRLLSSDPASDAKDTRGSTIWSRELNGVAAAETQPASRA